MSVASSRTPRKKGGGGHSSKIFLLHFFCFCSGKKNKKIPSYVGFLSLQDCASTTQSARESRDAKQTLRRSRRSFVQTRVGFEIRRLGKARERTCLAGAAQPCDARCSKQNVLAHPRHWNGRKSSWPHPASRSCGETSARETFGAEKSDITKSRDTRRGRRTSLVVRHDVVGDAPACSQCSPSPGSSMPTRVARQTVRGA